MADDFDGRKLIDPAAADAERVALVEAALDASQDGLIIIGLDQRIIKYNRRFLQMLGFTANELATGGVAYLLQQAAVQMEDGETVAARIRGYLKNPSEESLAVLRFRDGRVYQRFAAPLKIGGRIVGSVHSLSDISRSVRSENALEQHRAILEKAQEVAHIGSWVAELDGTGRVGWSRETHRIFGVPTEQFAGHVDGLFALVHQDDLETVRRVYSATMASGAACDVEHRIVRPDGEVRWVHGLGDALRDESGRPVRIVGTVQDITERRHLEDQLRQSQKLEAIGRLAGGVAHDINNALTAIAGYTELALGSLDTSHPRKADVAEIRARRRAGAAVTRQLLAFSRRQLREPRVFSLVDAAGNIGADARANARRGHRASDAISRGRAVGLRRPGQIEQAIVNLAINARDAMPGGGRLTLSLSTANVGNEFTRSGVHLPAGRYAELQVSDTGHGMTPRPRPTSSNRSSRPRKSGRARGSASRWCTAR